MQAGYRRTLNGVVPYLQRAPDLDQDAMTYLAGTCTAAGDRILTRAAQQEELQQLIQQQADRPGGAPDDSDPGSDSDGEA